MRTACEATFARRASELSTMTTRSILWKGSEPPRAQAAAAPDAAVSQRKKAAAASRIERKAAAKAAKGGKGGKGGKGYAIAADAQNPRYVVKLAVNAWLAEVAVQIGCVGQGGGGGNGGNGGGAAADKDGPPPAKRARCPPRCPPGAAERGAECGGGTGQTRERSWALLLETRALNTLRALRTAADGSASASASRSASASSSVCAVVPNPSAEECAAIEAAGAQLGRAPGVPMGHAPGGGGAGAAGAAGGVGAAAGAVAGAAAGAAVMADGGGARSVLAFEHTSHSLLAALLREQQQEEEEEGGEEEQEVAEQQEQQAAGAGGGLAGGGLALQRLRLAGWPGHFHAVWLDYCGTFSSLAGRQRQADLHALLARGLLSCCHGRGDDGGGDGGGDGNGAASPSSLLAVTLCQRGAAPYYEHELLDLLVLFVRRVAADAGLAAVVAGAVKYHVSRCAYSLATSAFFVLLLSSRLTPLLVSALT